MADEGLWHQRSPTTSHRLRCMSVLSDGALKPCPLSCSRSVTYACFAGMSVLYRSRIIPITLNQTQRTVLVLVIVEADPVPERWQFRDHPGPTVGSSRDSGHWADSLRVGAAGQ
jgi:hypothetical protein